MKMYTRILVLTSLIFIIGHTVTHLDPIGFHLNLFVIICTLSMFGGIIPYCILCDKKSSAGQRTFAVYGVFFSALLCLGDALKLPHWWFFIVLLGPALYLWLFERPKKVPEPETFQRVH
jgi:hypothetical protein